MRPWSEFCASARQHARDLCKQARHIICTHTPFAGLPQRRELIWPSSQSHPAAALPMHGMPADGTCFCAAFSSPIFFFFKSPSALSLSAALLFFTVVVNASLRASSMRRCGRPVLLFFVAVVSCMGGAGVSKSATQHLDTGRPGLRRATNCADHDPLCPARGFGGGAAAAATDDGWFILWLLGALCPVSDAMGLGLTVEGTEPRATGLG